MKKKTIGMNTWMVLCLQLIPTNQTSPSKAHSSSCMVGTHVCLEVEKFVEQFDEDRGENETLERHLTVEDVLQDHIEKICNFPKG